MFLLSLVLENLLKLQFCDDLVGCVKCPSHGDCTGKELVCESPYVAIRYDCAKVNSLPYYAQELSIAVEKYLSKKAFLYQVYSITEGDLVNQIKADHIVFYHFIQLLRKNQSSVLTWRKDSKRWVDINPSSGYWIGLLVCIDEYFWVLGLVGLFCIIFSRIRWLISNKIKID
jgi:hypothetical protein